MAYEDFPMDWESLARSAMNPLKPSGKYLSHLLDSL
jgi:hypothetical protein